MKLRRIAIAAIISACFGAPVSAQSTCKDTAGFVRTIGSDTVDVESAWFRRDTLSGFQASPSGVLGYTAWLDDSLNVTRAEVGIWNAGHPIAAPVDQNWGFRRIGDTVFFGARSPGRQPLLTQTVTPGIAFLLTAGSALEELLVRRLVRSGRPEIAMPIFYPGRTSFPVATVKRVGRDSATIAYTSSIVDLKIDGVGRVLGARYRQPEVSGDHMIVERVACGVVDPIIHARSNRPPRF